MQFRVFFAAIIGAIVILGGTFVQAQEPAQSWIRNPVISPDGRTIVFHADGDLYAVSSAGGMARPLTINEAWDGEPVWSDDGTQIAFASDRNGNLDVYVMPAGGGRAMRLTYQDTDDHPSGFSPDGKSVLFNAVRQDDPRAHINPRRRMPELYSISVTGGTPRQIFTTGASHASYNAAGTQIIYQREHARENVFRKHDTSAFARDIWRYDVATKHHDALTTNGAADHNPVWMKDGKGFYFLSERDGTFNVWAKQIGGKARQLTRHTQNPVRGLSAANDGLLTYSWHGALYTVREGETPVQLAVRFGADGHGRAVLPVGVQGKISEFALSPDGKELAFVSRGEVFVTAMDFATTRRITNTPGEERDVVFSPDGKALLYAGERDGLWRIFEATRDDNTETHFFTATKISERMVMEPAGGALKPIPSPDGKKIAFTLSRNTVQVFTRADKTSVTVLPDTYNHGESTSYINYAWSPDSQYLTLDMATNGRLFFTNIGIVRADGSGDVHDISLSGYTDAAPKWHSSGGIILWATGRYGRRDHGSHGADFDIMAAFLNQKALDRFSRSTEEVALDKEIEEAAKKEKENATKGKKKKSKKAEITPKATPVSIEWDNMLDRQKRLTIHSSRLADAVLSKDADKLYYLAAFEGGYDLWMQDFREEETKKLVSLDADRASLQLEKDGKTLVVLADGKLRKIDTEGDASKAKPVKLGGEVALKPDAERAELFDHIWRRAQDIFYKPGMHGVNWAFLRQSYGAKLPAISNTRDFADLTNEMLGELNASHTAARYRPRNKNADHTAALGVAYDPSFAGPGMRIMTVYPQSPLRKGGKAIPQGTLIRALNGTALTARDNYFDRLNNQKGKRLRLTLVPPGGASFDLVIKPVSSRDEAGWAYLAWVKDRNTLVEKLSDGRLGYVHIPNMSDSVFRVVYRELFGRHFAKDGVVLDTRDNAGGDLMEDLNRLLDGHAYTHNISRGREVQGEPITRWTKPSIVIANTSNYSDGHCFPATYQTLGIGKVVGMPIPGTCTYAGWEGVISGDMFWGVPQLGIKDRAGDWMEGKQTEPDIRIDNDPDSVERGEDKQLKAAVEALLAELDD
jgi:tricorn protease